MTPLYASVLYHIMGNEYKQNENFVINITFRTIIKCKGQYHWSMKHGIPFSPTRRRLHKKPFS